MKRLSSLILATAIAAFTLPVGAQVPGLLNYQGKVAVGTSPFTGTGQFKFALVDATGTITYWSNDGTSAAGSEPTGAVSRAVAKGVYSLLLGDASIPNMTAAVPSSVFANGDVRLRVWFDDGVNGSQLLGPDQRIASVGYAMSAATAETVLDGAITAEKIAPGSIGAAQLAPGITLDGSTTGAFIGNLTGNADSATTALSAAFALTATSATTAVTAQSAGNFTGSLVGDVTGTQGATVVSNVGSATASEVAAGSSLANAATWENSGSTIVLRDATGGFTAGIVDATGLSTTGTLSLSTTNSEATVGVVVQAGQRLLHTFGTESYFGGLNAGNFTLTGARNTGNGSRTLVTVTTGADNTGTGAYALNANTAGSFNAASGAFALYNSTTGNWNAADGAYALQSNTTGANNAASGARSLASNTTGANNIALGYEAGVYLTTGNYNITIGHGGVAAESGVIRIGTAGKQTDTYLTGVIHGDGSGLTGINTTPGDASITGAQIVNGAVGSTQLASGLTLGGNTTGTFIGTLTGNAATATFATAATSATSAGTAVSFTGELTGDVTGTQGSTVVSTVGASSAANLHAAELLANAATSTSTGSAIVMRDPTGGFSAGAITGSTFTAGGNFAMAATNSAGTVGVLTQGGSTLLHTAGNYNLFAGYGAGTLTTGSVRNTAGGAFALKSITTGSYNTASGAHALELNTTGNYNTASGLSALSKNTTGASNTASGADALKANTTGSSNIALGYQAGSNLVTGDNNIAIGNLGLAGDTGIIRIGTAQTDTYLTGIIHGDGSGLTGVLADAGTLTGTISIARIADGAVTSAKLEANITLTGDLTSATLNTGNITAEALSINGLYLANGQIFQGSDLLINSYQGSPDVNDRGRNFFAGLEAGNSSFQGVGNTGIGHTALAYLSGDIVNPSNDNTATGDRALYNNRTGSRNTATGRNALGNNMVGSDNIGLGYSAGASVTGSNNIDIGNLGYGNESGVIRIGDSSIHTNTWLSGVVHAEMLDLTGALLLRRTTGPSEGVIEQDGLSLLHSYGGDTFVNGNADGRNFFAGSGAGNFAFFGSGNTGTGDHALAALAGAGDNLVNDNTATGDHALAGNTAGSNNTGIGKSALQGNSIGSNNIALGSFAGVNIGGDYNIAIGHSGLPNEDRTIRFGDSNQTRTFLAGVVGVTTDVNDGVPVIIDSNGQLGTVSSSLRYKEDVADMGDTSARLQALRPVTFHYKKPYANGSKPVQYGLIAEEVAVAFPELAVINADGQPETVKYQDLTPLLLNEVQKLRSEKDALQQESTALRTRLEKLEAAFAAFAQ